MGEISAMEAGDVAAVTALFARVLGAGRLAPTPTLAGVIAEHFLRKDGDDEDLPSLVHRREDGSISGFIAVMPLRMHVAGKSVRAALCGSLCFDERDRDPFAANRLIRRYLAGGQDLSLSVTANDVSTAMWQSQRGVFLRDYSLEWLRMIRPCGLMIGMAAERLLPARLLRPIAGPIDTLLQRKASGRHRWWAASADASTAAKNPVRDEAAADDDLPDLILALADRFSASPSWDAAKLRQMLAEAAEKPSFGAFEKRVVRDRTGVAVGLYLLHAKPRGVGEVLQILARPGSEGVVIDAMAERAADIGLVALRGRVQPFLFDAMVRRRFVFTHTTSSVVHSRDEQLVRPFLEGRAFLNGLVGEAWTRLIGGHLD